MNYKHRMKWGRTDLSAGSGEGAGGGSSAADATPSTAMPAESAPSPAQTPQSDAGDEGDPLSMPDGTQLFQRDYVEKIRNEAARYRTTLRETEERLKGYDVFDAYDPEDRAVWTQMAEMWQRDPAEAAAFMRNIAESVLTEGQQPETAEQQPASELDEFEDLTPERIDQRIEAKIAEREAARQAAAEQERAVTAINDEITQAGFEMGSLESVVILQIASVRTGGDVTKAIQVFQESEKAKTQKAVDDYVAAMRNGGSSASPSGTPGSEQVRIESLDDAFARGRAYLTQSRQPG